MTLDSATAANAATIAAINPSTALVVLLLGLGIIYLLACLLKNTELTRSIIDRLDDDATLATVKDIRADQLKSNQERKEQGLRITAIEGRMDKLERKVETLDCRGSR